MNDMTEEQEEQFIRRNARRMKLSPWRLLEQIHSHGFELVRCNRNDGTNAIDFVRLTPAHGGLFDLFSVQGSLDGDPVSVSIATAITPSRCHHCRTDMISRSGDELGEFEFRCRTQAEAKQAELRISELLPSWFDLLKSEQPAFHEATSTAREAVDQYLQRLAPSDELDETWARLKPTASPEQRQAAERLLKTQFLHDLNLVRFRRVWEICQLEQVLCWEHEPEGLPGLNDLKAKPSEHRIEAHRRLQILASRLAREPGWPADDPLVPVRTDELIDPAPWRDTRLNPVAASIDLYLETTAQTCPCGKPWRLRQHQISGTADDRELILTVRCAAGHEQEQHLSAADLAGR